MNKLEWEANLEMGKGKEKRRREKEEKVTVRLLDERVKSEDLHFQLLSASFFVFHFPVKENGRWR